MAASLPSYCYWDQFVLSRAYSAALHVFNIHGSLHIAAHIYISHDPFLRECFHVKLL